MIVLKGSVLDFFKFVWSGALGNVSVVITDHLVEEGFGLISGSNLHAGIFDNGDDGHALIVELLLNLFLILSKGITKLGVFWVLLDGADGSNGGSLGSDLVLESNRK